MLTQNPPPRRSHSPGDFHLSERKRKRKALSCYQCRRRKLGCDREYPSCSRCRKSGQADSCTYESGSDRKDQADGEKFGGFPAVGTVEINESGRMPSAPDTEPPPEWTTEGHSSKVASQARRIAQLESRLAVMEASRPSATWQFLGEVASVAKTSENTDKRTNTNPAAFPTSPRQESSAETILFRGSNYKTQYYGGSNPTSLIAHFPELRSFMKESIMHHTSLPRVQRDLKALQVRWKVEKAEALPLKDFNLLDLLPAREIVDHLIHLYFDTFETMYRILHVPTFWKQYFRFWDDTQVARPGFVVILLLAMAAVNPISSKDPSTYIGDSATAREAAVIWIEACDSWVQRQSQKHVDLTMWQIYCLMILAKQSNIVKKKRTWTVAGNLMRQAMSAGFHRDPSLLGPKVSIFDQEMRRRLWATMVELELQASIDRGMPSALAGVSCDSANALNVNDEDFGEESRKPPSQRPWDEYTMASFLHISRSSLGLRVSLNAVLNELSSYPQYEDVLAYDDKIMQKLQDAPSRTNFEGAPDVSILPDLPRTLLDIQLRQFLILLHSPFARQAESNSRYSLSKMVCFNAASSILDQHSKLIKAGNYTLCVFRNDVFRGALAICHNIYVSIAVQNDLFLQNMSNSYFQYIENALVMLEEKITRLGTGYTNFWYISAAFGLVLSKASPGNAATQKQQAIDRVARQYYKVLASQEDIFSAKERMLLHRPTKSNAEETQIPSFDHAVATANPNLNPNSADLPFLSPNLAHDPAEPLFEEFYFGDPSAWTFDNLWNLDQIDMPDL